MAFGPIVRGAALAAVLIAAALAVVGPGSGGACRTTLGACAQEGVPHCRRDLGPWLVARSRTAGLPPTRSHSACVLRPPADAAPGRTGRASLDPRIAVVPQAPEVPGDTLISKEAAQKADHQRAAVTLAVRESLPDHWVFGLAGSFLDVGAKTGCVGLNIQPPVNAAYAIIGGNWLARPHGLYFERLADACVFDGSRAECDAPAQWIPHEFVAGETFALELGLQRDRDDAWWMDATVALIEDAPDGDTRRRDLGRMRQRVPAPCWLAADDPGRALVVVIPDPDAATRAPRGTRVEVYDFAWLD